MPSTALRIMNIKTIQWPEMEVMWICLNLLGEAREITSSELIYGEFFALRQPLQPRWPELEAPRGTTKEAIRWEYTQSMIIALYVDIWWSHLQTVRAIRVSEIWQKTAILLKVSQLLNCVFFVVVVHEKKSSLSIIHHKNNSRYINWDTFKDSKSHARNLKFF